MTKVVWPMGMDQDLSSSPLLFNPQRFLVVMHEDDSACERAETILAAGGFAPEDLRVYPSGEILEDHEAYLKVRSTAWRVVGALTDDQATIDLYFRVRPRGPRRAVGPRIRLVTRPRVRCGSWRTTTFFTTATSVTTSKKTFMCAENVAP